MLCVRRDILRHFSNQSEHLGNEGIVRVHVERQASLPTTNLLLVNWESLNFHQHWTSKDAFDLQLLMHFLSAQMLNF